jgi:hypothetical protein
MPASHLWLARPPVTLAELQERGLSERFHEPSPDSTAETAQMVIHQAFDEAERLLEGRLGRQRAHRQDQAPNE